MSNTERNPQRKPLRAVPRSLIQGKSEIVRRVAEARGLEVQDLSARDTGNGTPAHRAVSPRDDAGEPAGPGASGGRTGTARMASGPRGNPSGHLRFCTS